MIGALLHDYEFRYYDRHNGYPSLARTMRLDIELDAVATGEVEFVMAMPSWMKSKKELIIHESPQMGSGAWTVSIDANSRSARNGLYTYQLNGAYLEFKDNTLIESWKTFVRNAPPGSRVHFNWVSNSMHEEAGRLYRSIAEYVDRYSGGHDDHQILQEPEAVPLDQVEFVMRNHGRRRIDILINESPSIGPGMWTLSTNLGRPVDQNGLYMYQVRPGASLVTQSYYRSYNRVDKYVEVIEISDATPGTRYTIQWTS